MIEIRLNDRSLTLNEGTTVAELVDRHGEIDSTVVAVNDVFVPRAEHGTYRLAAGDRVELLSPMEGG